MTNNLGAISRVASLAITMAYQQELGKLCGTRQKAFRKMLLGPKKSTIGSIGSAWYDGYSTLHVTNAL